LRVYQTATEIEKRKNPSILILTTSKGVMTSKEALKNHLGGEIFVEIW